jgi:hypothetical protein
MTYRYIWTIIAGTLACGSLSVGCGAGSESTDASGSASAVTVGASQAPKDPTAAASGGCQPTRGWRTLGQATCLVVNGTACTISGDSISFIDPIYNRPFDDGTGWRLTAHGKCPKSVFAASDLQAQDVDVLVYVSGVINKPYPQTSDDPFAKTDPKVGGGTVTTPGYPAVMVEFDGGGYPGSTYVSEPNDPTSITAGPSSAANASVAGSATVRNDVPGSISAPTADIGWPGAKNVQFGFSF